MKKLKVALIISLAIITFCTFPMYKYVIADEYNQGYTTTIVQNDGLDYQLVEVLPSDVLDSQEYIKANLDANYANLEKFEAVDTLQVKNLLADKNYLGEEKTIDAMHENTPEAFLMLNDITQLVYDVDDNSEYYVALANTMHNSQNYVTDYSVAYTNMNGEVIYDCIYDYDTGLLYIPKKYKAEDKNGLGANNVQIELLQNIDGFYGQTAFNVIVSTEDVEGQYANSGIVTIQAPQVKFGVRVALDEVAREYINVSHIRVYINDVEYNAFSYMPDEGMVVINQYPGCIETLKIDISAANSLERLDTMTVVNGADNLEYLKETQSNPRDDKVMETWATDSNIIWRIDGAELHVGQLIKISGSDKILDVYDANGGVYKNITGYSIYSENGNWQNLTATIHNGGSINTDNLSNDPTYLHHYIKTLSDINADGLIIPANQTWWLKCVHNATTFTSPWSRYDVFDDGYARPVSNEIWIRIFEIGDDYIVCGMLTRVLNNQAGAGVFKVQIGEEKGSLKLGKKDDYGRFVAGAKFSISGPDGYYNEITTTDSETQIDGLKKGHYTVKEIEAPYKFIRNNNEFDVEVKSKEVTECYIANSYQRGSVTLYKTDGDNKIEGSPRLDGAVFKFCAAEDIWEGGEKRYSANQVIDENVVTNADGTTKVFTNMPIGKYYYEEVKNPYGYYKKDGHFDVEVKYTNQDRPNATDEAAICAEDQQYNDIRIVKKREETSNYPEDILEGAQFTATLQHRPDDYNQDPVVGVSEYQGDGVYLIKHLPVGDYVVEETVVPDKTFKSKNFNVTIDEGENTHGPYALTEENGQEGYGFINIKGELVDTSIKMVIKIRKVDYDRTDDQDIDWTQGDANLEGAIYRIYELNEQTGAYDKEVYDITVNKHDTDGCWYAESGKLLVGNYMVKEVPKSTEVKDGVTYEYSYAEGYLVDPNPYYFSQDVKAHEDTPEVSHYHETSKEKVQRGAVKVVKYDNDSSNVDHENDSDKAPSAGAVLRMTLDSNPSIYYTVKLNDKGEGEFLETNDETHTSTAAHDSMHYYPYTIPYGNYTITEDKEADGGENTSFYIQHVTVEINKQAKTEYRIEADEPVPVWLRVVKIDKTTNEPIGLAGAKFKIYDINEHRWVSMKVGVGTYIEEFETNNEGYFYSPQKLYAGEYIVYETGAPEGFYLEPEWRVPTNKDDLGNPEKGGKYVKVDKISTGLTAEEVYPGGIEIGELVLETKIKESPLMVNIKVVKTGEKLVGASQETFTYTKSDDSTEELEVVLPTYKDKVGIQGVEYKIYANEDIKTPDGTLRARNGQLMKDADGTDVIVTNEEGIARSWDLYPGKYKIVETKVPKGYLLDTVPKYIEAENKDQYVKSATATLELQDVRQQLGYKFKKIFKEYKYATGTEQKHAIFGVYNSEPIMNYKDQQVIDPDTLMDVIEVVGNNYVETDTDFPEGKYYVKEIYVSYPYAISNKVVNFELEYNDDGVTKKVTVEGEEIDNTPEFGYAKFIKLSKSIDDGLITNGSNLINVNLDKKASDILDKISNMTRDEMMEYFNTEKVKFVPGAVYEIWLDEKGTNKLLEVDLQTGDKRVATFTTDNIGILELFELPKGAYYLKEVVAPKGYKIQNDAIPFEITSSNPETTLFQAIYDESSFIIGVHKTDMFTGKDVPNCKFEVRDSEGKRLMYAITDNEGFAHIPMDLFKEGEKYYYVEIEAPDVYDQDGTLYKLNTEPHEFIAHYDENGMLKNSLVEVENYRPTTNVKFVKTDEESNLVPNCKFELKSEEENLYYKTGVTDENGIYVFENVPQGWYTYTELEAPEEYDLDTTPHRVYVTGDEMVIDFVNTGDIPVVAIATLAIVCVAGIAFVTVRKFKLAKNN